MNVVQPIRTVATRGVHGRDLPEQPFGFRDLWELFRRRRRVLAGAAAITVSLVAAYTFLQPREYTATAVIMLNPTPERVVNEEQALNQGAPNSALVDSEIEVLRSQQLARQLADVMELVDDPRWNRALRQGSSPLDWVKTLRRWVFGGRQAEMDGADAVAAEVADAIGVKRRGVSYVIEVSTRSGDAAEAAAMANRLVELYVGFDDEARISTGQRASTWLEQRVAELRADVQAKEDSLQRFRVQSGLLSSDGVSLTERQISDVQTSVLAARAALAESEARYRLVQSLQTAGVSGETMASALDSNVIRDLRQREVDQVRRQAERESELGELHPSVVSGRAELENIRAQIRAEVGRIQAAARNEVEVARSRLASLEQNLASVRGQLVSNNDAMVRANELEREATASRSVYESFLERYHIISDQGRLDPSRIRIISQAQTPASPSSPRIGLGLLLALGLGLAAGVVAALVAESMDEALSSGDEIVRRLGVPAVASIPLLSQKSLRLLDPSERHPAGYVVDKPMSAFAEAFRVLKGVIRYSSPDRKHLVVAITSALPAEGKTTCAFSLARVAALAGQRVVLVDCDLRRRSLNQLLQIEPQRGLLQVLAGEIGWTEIIGSDNSTGAHVLPAAADAFTPRDMFNSDAMAKLVDELRRSYELVLLDCPPVLAVAETRDLVGHADCAVLIGRSGKTPVRAAASALNQLAMTDTVVLGVAVNCIDVRSIGRASYSGGFYYDASETYYTQ